LTVSGRDLSDVTASLAATNADYRVLSAHYGTEFDVTTSSSDRRRFAAVLQGGADMIVGHHQHVAAGIEIVEGKPVFYGLGNFLHWVDMTCATTMVWSPACTSRDVRESG
jgi:poly-gamma-glutamate synthesis protein (capsule biosynthesis protein)